MLSLDEFTSLVLMIHPAASEERVWAAFRECIELAYESEVSSAASPGDRPLSAGSEPSPLMVQGGITADIFCSVVQDYGLLGVSLSSEIAKAAEGALAAEKRGRIARGATSGSGSLTHGDGGYRMEMLSHDIESNETSTRSQLSELRRKLASIAHLMSFVRGSTAIAAQEKLALTAEVDEVDASLARVHGMLGGDESADAAVATRAWETYRNLRLKLNRAGTRADELLQSLQPPPSSPEYDSTGEGKGEGAASRGSSAAPAAKKAPRKSS